MPSIEFQSSDGEMFKVDVEIAVSTLRRRCEAILPSNVSPAIPEKLSERRPSHKHDEKESEQLARTPKVFLSPWVTTVVSSRAKPFNISWFFTLPGESWVLHCRPQDPLQKDSPLVDAGPALTTDTDLKLAPKSGVSSSSVILPSFPNNRDVCSHRIHMK
ncbi:hypothetical protein STEG23_004860 [Scotinomys teguina]